MQTLHHPEHQLADKKTREVVLTRAKSPCHSHRPTPFRPGLKRGRKRSKKEKKKKMRPEVIDRFPVLYRYVRATVYRESPDASYRSRNPPIGFINSTPGFIGSYHRRFGRTYLGTEGLNPERTRVLYGFRGGGGILSSAVRVYFIYCAIAPCRVFVIIRLSDLPRSFVRAKKSRRRDQKSPTSLVSLLEISRVSTDAVYFSYRLSAVYESPGRIVRVRLDERPASMFAQCTPPPAPSI